MKNTRNQEKSANIKKTKMAVNQTATKRLDKPFEQENRKPKKGLTKVVTVGIVILLAVIFVFVSGAFNITEILVENNEIISDQQIISFSGIEKGTNLFSVSKREVRKKLMENSYVREVQIKRCLPNKIKLVVEERKTEYAVQLANSYLYLDRQGYILEISNNPPNVPILLGCTTDLSNVKPNKRLEEADLQKMNMVLKIMEVAEKNNLKNLITKIDISDENNYTIYLDTEAKIAYLGKGTQLNTRFLYIKKLLEIYQGKAGEILVDGDLNSEYIYFRENG